MENGHRHSWFTHKTWWFSIVMSTFTRGYFFRRWGTCPGISQLRPPPVINRGNGKNRSFYCRWFSQYYKLVGGLEHFLFSHILGIMIPIDFHIFQRGGPTTNQYKPSFIVEFQLSCLITLGGRNIVSHWQYSRLQKMHVIFCLKSNGH